MAEKYIPDLQFKLMLLLEDLCEERDTDKNLVYTYSDIATKVIEFFKANN